MAFRECFVSTFFLVLALNYVNAETLCENEACKNANCRNAFPEDCSSTQQFYIADPKYGRCCSECIDCNPETCALAGACLYNPRGQNDCKKGEKFIPYDGLCNCCSHCKTCDPTFCQRVDCYNAKKSECKADEEFIPADGLCTCCSYCKKNITFL